MFKKKKKEGKGLFKHLKKEKKGLYKDRTKEKKNLFPKKESKVAEWNRIKREITPYFIENDIYNICELGLEGCTGNAIGLTYAHSKKRGDIATKEPERTRELKEVVRACPACHHKIEYIPKELGGRKKMYEIVTEVIRKREERLGRYK